MKKVKFRKSLATNIIVIFMVFNILSIVLFTYYVTIKEESKSTEYAKKSMQEIVDEKSELIAITFDRIKTQVGLLGIWTEKLLQEAWRRAVQAQMLAGRIDATQESLLMQGGLCILQAQSDCTELISRTLPLEAAD